MSRCDALSEKTHLMARATDAVGQGNASLPQAASPFRYFNSSPEAIRLVVMMYVRFPLSLRNVEDLLFERGIDICHETVQHWWNRFGPMFAANIRRQRVCCMGGFRPWKWHLAVCSDNTTVGHPQSTALFGVVAPPEK